MSCTHWKDDWVADLYGELEPAERDRMHRHLAGCETCRRTVADLQASRAALREHAPAVPEAPRFVPLPAAGRRRRAVPAFAAGLAAAVVLFVAGALAAPWIRPDAGPAGDGMSRAEVRAAIDAALAEQRAAFESELAARRPVEPTDDVAVPASGDDDGYVMRAEFDRALAALERRIHLDRASDVEFLLGELQATEARAAEWFDDNREALMLVAMQNDPRLSER